MEKRAAVYCRVSTQGQAKDGYSLDWQMENMPKLAANAGATITDEDIFVEVKSGAKDDRPEYNRLMAKIMDGYYQEVWAVEKSRLSRTENRAEEQRIVEALQKFGCVIRTPGGTIDVSTIEGEFFNDIDSAVNRMERKRIKSRIETGKLAKLKTGGYTGGMVPAGYRPASRDLATGKLSFEIDPEKAPLIRLVFQYALSGMTARAISIKLYNDGYRSSTNGRIYHGTILEWLRNPHYAGYTQWGHGAGSKAKKILIEKNQYLEPLISKEDFQRVQDLLNTRASKHNKRVRAPLSGILVCCNCGKGMISESWRTRKVYTCSSRNYGERCTGGKPKNIAQGFAHEAFLAILPGLVKYIQKIGAPSQVKRSANNENSVIDRLEAQKDALYKKIMANIIQQEDAFSEIRKFRIAELEEKYKAIELEIEAEGKKKPIKIPEVGGWEKILPLLTVDDNDEIGMIASALARSIQFRRAGHTYSEKYEIIRIFTTWGDVVKVRSNKYVYFERREQGF